MKFRLIYNFWSIHLNHIHFYVIYVMCSVQSTTLDFHFWLWIFCCDDEKYFIYIIIVQSFIYMRQAFDINLNFPNTWTLPFQLLRSLPHAGHLASQLRYGLKRIQQYIYMRLCDMYTCKQRLVKSFNIDAHILNFHIIRSKRWINIGETIANGEAK